MRLTPRGIVVGCVAVAVAAGAGWAIAGGSGSGDPAPAPNGASGVTEQSFPQREVAVQPRFARPANPAGTPAP